MIDYRAHAIVLDQCRQALASATIPDENIASKRDQTLIDVAKAGDYAQLGALIDHLMVHAASDGVEVRLLERASRLWERGVKLYDSLGGIRAEVEAALDSPADPASPGRFNKAAVEAQNMAVRLHEMQGEIMKLRDDIDPLPHLRPHPRQEDKKSDAWDWGNLFVGRRTDAFVRELSALAHDTPTRAFAFGVLSSYAGNASGSAYLGRAVGGPRRAHRYRDRLARNAVGSWLAEHFPGQPTAFADMANALRFGAPGNPSLPSSVATLVNKAIAGAFDLSRTDPVPDLDAGYQRLLRHLELLGSFSRPPIPAMPSGSFTVKIFGDPTKPPPTLRPQSAGTIGGGGGGGGGVGGNTPGASEPDKTDSKDSGGGLCGLLITLLVLFIILLVVAFIKCLVEWGSGNKCNYFEELGDLITGLFEEDPPDPREPTGPQDPETTNQSLTAIAGTEDAVKLVAYLFDLHMLIWEALEYAYTYLAVTGLVYPDGLLNRPLYAQFTQISNQAVWPRRPEPDPEKTYHLYPVSAVENPTVPAPDFPAGSRPDAFIKGLPQALVPVAEQIALPLWEQMAREVADSGNLDLDADRGFGHNCWKSSNSIEDDPLDVITLAYADQ